MLCSFYATYLRKERFTWEQLLDLAVLMTQKKNNMYTEKKVTIQKEKYTSFKDNDLFLIIHIYLWEFIIRKLYQSWVRSKYPKYLSKKINWRKRMKLFAKSSPMNLKNSRKETIFPSSRNHKLHLIMDQDCIFHADWRWIQWLCSIFFWKSTCFFIKDSSPDFKENWKIIKMFIVSQKRLK